MNSHFFDHMVNEKFVDTMRSIELFLGLLVAISIVGFIFLAAV